MAIKITRRDVMSNEVVDPDWYPVTVAKLDVAPANTDQSTNYIYTLKFAADDLKDVSINKVYINEKGVFGAGMAFIKATCGLTDEMRNMIKNKQMDEPEFDENIPVGKTILAKVQPNKFNDRVTNAAVDFMPISS